MDRLGKEGITIDCVAFTGEGIGGAEKRRLSTCRNARADTRHVKSIFLSDVPLLSSTGSIP